MMPCHRDGRRRAGPQSRADCPRRGNQLTAAAKRTRYGRRLDCQRDCFTCVPNRLIWRMPDDPCRIVVSAVLRRAAGFSPLPAARRGHVVRKA
jgi:hypothetical protein